MNGEKAFLLASVETVIVGLPPCNYSANKQRFKESLSIPLRHADLLDMHGLAGP